MIWIRFFYRASRSFRFRVANRTRGSRAPCRTSVVEERTEREDRTEGETQRHITLIMLYENICMVDLEDFVGQKIRAKDYNFLFKKVFYRN